MRIEAQVTGSCNGPTCAAIHEALNTIPAVRSALGDGALAVDVRLLPEGEAIARGAKRVLDDLRD